MVLFIHKLFELKKGTTFISLEARQKADAVIESALYEKKQLIVKKSKHVVRTSLVKFKKTVRATFLYILHIIHKKLTQFLERMKTRSGVRKPKGDGVKAPVSLFLKNVGEFKEEIRTGQEVDGIKEVESR